MKPGGSRMHKLIAVLGLAVLIMACGLTSNPDASSTPTPTIPAGMGNDPPPGADRCEGVNGELELQILVGPADVVGLEPFAVGTIPFSVISEGGVHVLQGGGSVSYQDVLQTEWGTYTVEFNLESSVEGECLGDDQGGVLDMTLEIRGEQMVEVRSEGFQGDYPWSGSFTVDLSLPLEEGATSEGEGWTFVLHLNE